MAIELLLDCHWMLKVWMVLAFFAGTIFGMVVSHEPRRPRWKYRSNNVWGDDFR